MSMEPALDLGRRLIQEGLCGRMVFFANASSQRSNSESQGDVFPETPKMSILSSVAILVQEIKGFRSLDPSVFNPALFFCASLCFVRYRSCK